MATFNWFKALVFGALIWAVMFLLVWATVGMGIFGSVWTQVVLGFVAGIVSYLFALNAKSDNIGTAFGYGAVFAAVGIILDLLISQQLLAGLFGLWTYYLAYGLILLAPPALFSVSEAPSSRAV